MSRIACGPALLACSGSKRYVKHAGCLKQEFTSGLCLAQLMPGGTVVNLVTFLGYQLFGLRGAVLVPCCFLLPSVILMTGLSALYFTFGAQPAILALFTGLRAVAVALFIHALLTMGKVHVKTVRALLLGLGVFLLCWFRLLPILAIIPLCAGTGWLWLPSDTSLIQAELPPATGFPWRHYWPLAVLAPVLAGLCLAFLHTPLTQVVLALCRVGAMTFGGGYTLIPVFQQEIVDHQHWMSGRQFLDGIALGQMTPGPVMTTGAFVGYHLSGIIGAVLGTVAIYLAGWLSVLLTAPWYSRLCNLGWLRKMEHGIAAGFLGMLLATTVRLSAQAVVGWWTGAFALAALFVLVVAKKDPVWAGWLDRAIPVVFLFAGHS